MSDIKYDELKKNDDVIFARILPKLNVYETINLHITSIFATHCIGIDPKTKKRYCFIKEDAEEHLFKDKSLANEYLKKKKEENKNIKTYV